MATAQKSSSRNAADGRGFTAEEKAAMRERAREQKAEARSKDARADGEKDLLTKIAEMPAADKAIAERLHALITAAVPDLAPKTWYGMPAYARDGKIVCFFQAADKFKARYATFGFSDEARIDDGAMWPTSYALTKLTKADEDRIVELVKKAIG
jgi:uncharacterized protein YdhG (YjbR/CyaY superfamily)